MNLNTNKVYLGSTEINKIYLGDICIKGCTTLPQEPVQPWMAEKYMNGELLAEFEATLPWQITDGDTVIADFTDFSADGLTASYTFYKDTTTALNANAVYNGASPEYDNVDGYNWKFSVPEPYKIKVEQTNAQQKPTGGIDENGILTLSASNPSYTIKSSELLNQIKDNITTDDSISLYLVISMEDLDKTTTGTVKIIDESDDTNPRLRYIYSTKRFNFDSGGGYISTNSSHSKYLPYCYVMFEIDINNFFQMALSSDFTTSAQGSTTTISSLSKGWPTVLAPRTVIAGNSKDIPLIFDPDGGIEELKLNIANSYFAVADNRGNTKTMITLTGIKI